MVWKALILTLAFIAPTSPWVRNSVEPIEPVEPVTEIIEIENKTQQSAPSTVAKSATTDVADIDVGNMEAVGNPDMLTEDGWHVIEGCTITHYCHGACCCGKWAGSPTASGAWPEAGRTVAVDPSVIPLGSEVLINGHVYVAEDTGVSGYWVDIFCDSHSEALNRGMYYTEVMWR